MTGRRPWACQIVGSLAVTHQVRNSAILSGAALFFEVLRTG